MTSVPGVVLPLLTGVAAQAHGSIDIEWFFLVLAAILLAGKIAGELAERIGQPAVLGELIAGVLLGASALGVIPAAGSIHEVVQVLAEIGVAILLFEIGLETDVKEMFRVGPSASVVAVVGVTVPFVLGFMLWMILQPPLGAPAAGISHQTVAIFIGATLTATSVGITARVLSDLHRLNSPEGRIIIGAAVVDDILGLVILAVVSGIAAGAGVSLLGIARTLLVAVGFLVGAVVIGNLIAPWLFQMVDRMRVRGVLLVAAFVFALVFAALAGMAGSALIIGSFAAGIVLSSTNQFDMIMERIKPVADIFTPIFFLSVGAAVDVSLFVPGSDTFSPPVLTTGAALLLVAVVGKVVSGYSVGWGRGARLSHLAIGIGMIPRGEVGLIFADLGLDRGVLTREVFSAVLIMVIFTTFISPPLLKVVFRRTSGAEPPPPMPGAPAHREYPPLTE